MMYMLKIRFGKSFGSRAGGCWRLLFVSALMPWLSSYNVTSLPQSARRSETDHQDIETIESHMRDISQRQNQSANMNHDASNERGTVISRLSCRRNANEEILCDDSVLTERSKSQRNIISAQSREAMKRARLPSEDSFNQDLSKGSWSSPNYQPEKPILHKEYVEVSTISSDKSDLL
jgi:hypothetical protein